MLKALDATAKTVFEFVLSIVGVLEGIMIFCSFFRNPISADLILCEETPLLYWANCLNREKKGQQL